MMTKSLRVIQGNRKYQTPLLPGYLVEYTPRCQIRAASFRVTLSIHFFASLFLAVICKRDVVHTTGIT